MSAVWGGEYGAEDIFWLFALTNGQSCIVKKSARVDVGHSKNKCMLPWRPLQNYLYSTHRDVYIALPRPPFGKSDHNSILSSCPDLRDPNYSLCLVRSGCGSGGKSMFSISLFWPSVVPNQRQLSIVVSDWGSHISCHFPFGFCGILFSVSLLYLTELDAFVFKSYFV
jgi:hypothetical protein